MKSAPTAKKSMVKKPSAKLRIRRKRIEWIISTLKEMYPDVKCSLDYANPLQLLVATILSAQCTDVRVNIVTRDLFGKYRSAADYAKAPVEALEKDIQSTGFYRNKAKSLHGMAEALVKEYAGKVPDEMDELVKLPGVGRKTANVVLGNAFGKSDGVVVDTHVTRVANRLDLTDHDSDAVKIEQELVQIVPREEWTRFSHLLIYHGRALCTARNPKCEQCPLRCDCPAGKKFVAARAKVR